MKCAGKSSILNGVLQPEGQFRKAWVQFWMVQITMDSVFTGSVLDDTNYDGQCVHRFSFGWYKLQFMCSVLDDTNYNRQCVHTHCSAHRWSPSVITQDSKTLTLALDLFRPWSWWTCTVLDSFSLRWPSVVSSTPPPVITSLSPALLRYVSLKAPLTLSMPTCLNQQLSHCRYVNCPLHVRSVSMCIVLECVPQPHRTTFAWKNEISVLPKCHEIDLIFPWQVLPKFHEIDLIFPWQRHTQGFSVCIFDRTLNCGHDISTEHSSGAVWESRWPSWAVRPNEPSGFRGRKELLHRASALVTACP